jgi:hypothetical protein
VSGDSTNTAGDELSTIFGGSHTTIASGTTFCAYFPDHTTNTSW